jgi:hypothetical protein
MLLFQRFENQHDKKLSRREAEKEREGEKKEN